MISVPFKDALSGQADCKNCSLRGSVLFSGLAESDFEQLHKPINQFTLKPGDYLYKQGSMGDRMFTIRSGLVKLSQSLPDGSQRIVRLIGTSGVTGLESMLGSQYEHDATVMQTTEICCLPVESIKVLSNSNPNLHTELLRRWHLALTEADTWLTELSTGSAKQRIARLLLRLTSNQSDTQFTLFGREDLGAMLGITTETASRTVADFRRRGLITEVNNNIFIANIEQLETEANGS